MTLKTLELLYLMRIHDGQNPTSWTINRVREYILKTYTKDDIVNARKFIDTVILFLNNTLGTTFSYRYSTPVLAYQPVETTNSKSIIVIVCLMTLYMELSQPITGNTQYDKLNEYFTSQYSKNFVKNYVDRKTNEFVSEIHANTKQNISAFLGYLYQSTIKEDILSQSLSTSAKTHVLKTHYTDTFRDLDKWNIRDNYDNNNKKMKYNVRLTADGLQIDVKKESDGTWSAGSIFSKFRRSYGYYECSMKYAEHNGVNNAFWMTSPMIYLKDGTNILYEIDGNEGHGRNVLTQTVHHWLNDYKSSVSPVKYILTSNKDLRKEYHTYGVLYTKDRLEWFFDDEITGSYQHTLPLDTAITIQFSTAVLATAGSVPPTDTTMSVKYVRYHTLLEKDNV